MHLGIIAVVFGIIFVAELPDKSMFASLALSTRFRRSYVWLGAAAAFLTHVIIAVTAGQLMTLLPHRILEFIVAFLFLLGATLLAAGSFKKEDLDDEEARIAKQTKHAGTSFKKAFAISYGVVFLGEWGDITQIATANYAAKYHDPISVGIGATAALWCVAGIGVLIGAKLITRIPAHTLQRVTAVVLFVFGAISLTAAIR